MLSAFRKLAGTWPARIFFVVLAASFASWGIADMVRNIAGSPSAVATVHGHDITPEAFRSEYQTAMRRYAEQIPDPSQLPPALKMQVARQTLERLVTQQALADEVQAMGLVVPEDQVAASIFAMTQFQGPDGKFSFPIMQSVLQNNSMTEGHLKELVRQDIAQNQILGAVGAASNPPELLTDLVFRYLNERRQADILMLPFAGQPLPAAPAESVLRRYYDNNADRYTAPEYRHIKVAILSPDSIGRSLTVSDADLHSYFDAHKSDYVSAEKRSLQVITAPSAVVAAKLAALWRGGASWDAVQAAAKAAEASATPLDNATIKEIPSPELAKAAFDATANTVLGPINEPLGSYVLKVTAITPGRNPSFDSLKDEIHGKVAAAKALDLIDARAQKLQDLFAGGAKIDEVPGDLGATGAEGTLDAKGITPDGNPAPIPATADARQQIIDTAFKTNPADAIQATEGPDHVWYAVAVDSVTKPARRPFDDVRAQVTRDWQRDQVHHAQETEAARILALVNGGKSLADAAWGGGRTVTQTPPLLRNRPAPGVPAELNHTLFTLKLNEATMAETNAGFVVAQLSKIIPPDRKSDALELGQAHDGLIHALHDDYVELYATALRTQAKPVIRPNVVQSLITQPGE
jgi:peptidyl-prolyl cis-trans isomerase D